MIKHVGILGGGNISETHLRAVSEIDGLEVSAVCGRNQEKVKRLADRCGAAAYSELERFLEHRPLDLVLIGSPSGLHAEEGMAAARRGLHVLVEKPIDVTTERADALISECRQAGVKLGVFFQDRVSPDIVRLKNLLVSNQLGRPLLVSAHVRWHRPEDYYRDSRWRGTWALDGGGALMNQGVHTVDLLLWLLGDVRRVYARTATLLHDIETEDTAVAVLEFANGTLAILEAATSAYPGYPRRLVLTGTEGTATLEHDQLVALDLRRAAVSDFTAGERNLNPSASSPVVSDVRGHREIIQDFVQAVSNDGAPLCDGREGRRSVELVQAIYESSRTHQPVELGSSA